MKKELLIILLLTFVNILNFAIMIPVLPFIVQSFGGGSIMYGILLSVYPLFQFFAAPLLGAWSDMIGRRPVLLISQAGTFLCWVIFAISYFVPKIYVGPVALPLAVIMFARIADGATGGNNSVANAYITDKTKAHERSKIFGFLGGIVGLGLIVGPSIGGFTSSLGIGYLGTALTNMGISFITLVLMYVYLPETLLLKERDKKFHFKFSDEIRFISKIRRYSQNRMIKYLLSIRISFLLIFNGFTSIMVLFLIDQFKLNQREIGLLFLITGSYVIINQMVIAPFLSRKIGELKTFLLGLLIFIIFLPAILYAPNVLIYLVVAYFVNVGFSISFPTFKSLLSNNVDEGKQGEIQGIDESLIAAAATVAPVTAGYMYSIFGKYSFGLFSAFLLVPYVYFVTHFKKKSA